MGFTNQSGSRQGAKNIFLDGIEIKGGNVEFTENNTGGIKVNALNPVSGDSLTVYGGLSVVGGLSG